MVTEKKNRQPLLKIPFVRERHYARARDAFIAEKEAQGVLMRNEDVPGRLCGIRTLIIDAPLVMEGRNVVRLAAAPLAVCTLERIKHERAWMMLTAGVALGCEGYAPLEDFARDMGFSRALMLKQYPCVETVPYDDARGVETTLHRDAGGIRAFAKGAPEAVVACCERVLDGRERPLDARDCEHIIETSRRLERDGLRTLAFATRRVPEGIRPETGMTYLGLVAMGDVPFADAPAGMEALRRAEVRPVLAAGHGMLPGAVEGCGVLRPHAGMMAAPEIEAMGDMALREAVAHADAFLGVDWTQKVRLARALRGEGLVGTLSPDPNGGGMVLAIGGGAAPDVVIEIGGLETVAALLDGCRALRDAYEPR